MIIAAVYPFIRRLLFSLDPELAHKLALQALMVCCRKSHLEPTQHDAKTCMGLHFANPLGLAAGFDKNGCYIDALGSLGFGFIEVGTVTPMPQAGNPRPRVFRLEGDQAIINRMGFNSDGMACVAQRLAKRRYRGVLGINIGKNKSTLNQEAARDYLACMKTLSSYADYFTINIS